MMLINILLALLCYIFGSIPGGLIVGKLYNNTDIRKKGSKNLGSTNAIRVLGLIGVLAFVIDFLKSYLPLYILTLLNNDNIINLNFAPFYFGIFSAIGHCYPIFANFKGGKAVATSLGILFIIDIRVAFCVLIIFLIVLMISKMVSLSSLCAVFSAVIYLIIFDYPIVTVIYVFMIALLIFYRHIPNIKRIINHEEAKIKLFKK